MVRARLLSVTVYVFAVSACATQLPSPELDPALPSGGISLERALEVARNYGSSNGREVVLALRAGQFTDLSSIPAARGLNRWVWRVEMQGSYPRNSCVRPHMTTPPPCPDVQYKTVVMDYLTGDVITAGFGTQLMD